MAENYECFKVDVADFVATVRLARPPVNAQNRRFREEIIAIFDALSDRADVRAIVLMGEGKIFSAGADLKERPSLSQETGAYPRHNRIVRESFNAVMECEKPVIAAINGAAIGAGCVLALCCDILIASEAGYLAMTEVDVGLAGGVSHVRRFFRESDARLLIYTARRMSGAELYRMGVVVGLRFGRRTARHRTRYRTRNRRQESPCNQSGKTILQRYGGHGLARRLSLRTVPNGGACFHGRYEGSAAGIR